VGFDNVIITPHVANTWDMALPALAARVERNVLAPPPATPGGQVDVDLGTEDPPTQGPVREPVHPRRKGSEDFHAAFDTCL